MKRLLALIIFILITYVVYYDLTIGTLPVSQQTAELEIEANDDPTIPYFEKKVSSGETVLTIVEKKMDAPLPVSITQMISDFQQLNNGLQPEQLKAGELYRFPIYKQE